MPKLLAQDIDMFKKQDRGLSAKAFDFIKKNVKRYEEDTGLENTQKYTNPSETYTKNVESATKADTEVNNFVNVLQNHKKLLTVLIKPTNYKNLDLSKQQAINLNKLFDLNTLISTFNDFLDNEKDLITNMIKKNDVENFLKNNVSLIDKLFRLYANPEFIGDTRNPNNNVLSDGSIRKDGYKAEVRVKYSTLHKKEQLKYKNPEEVINELLYPVQLYRLSDIVNYLKIQTKRNQDRDLNETSKTPFDAKSKKDEYYSELDKTAKENLEKDVQPELDATNKNLVDLFRMVYENIKNDKDKRIFMKLNEKAFNNYDDLKSDEKKTYKYIYTKNNLDDQFDEYIYNMETKQKLLNTKQSYMKTTEYTSKKAKEHKNITNCMLIFKNENYEKNVPLFSSNLSIFLNFFENFISYLSILYAIYAKIKINNYTKLNDNQIKQEYESIYNEIKNELMTESYVNIWNNNVDTLAPITYNELEDIPVDETEGNGKKAGSKKLSSLINPFNASILYNNLPGDLKNTVNDKKKVILNKLFSYNHDNNDIYKILMP